MKINEQLEIDICLEEKKKIISSNWKKKELSERNFAKHRLGISWRIDRAGYMYKLEGALNALLEP